MFSSGLWTPRSLIIGGMRSPHSLSSERRNEQRLAAHEASNEHPAETARPDRVLDLEEVERALFVEPVEPAARAAAPQPADDAGTVERRERQRLRDGERFYFGVYRAERLLMLRVARLRQWLDAHEFTARDTGNSGSSGTGNNSLGSMLSARARRTTAS